MNWKKVKSNLFRNADSGKYYARVKVVKTIVDAIQKRLN